MSDLDEAVARALPGEQRREVLTDLRREVASLSARIGVLENTCTHEFERTSAWRGVQSEWVSCRWCGKDGGWYCPDSPDHSCHYEQPDGSYNDDHCRYCGNPEERK